MKNIAICAAVLGLALSSDALAQSPEYMMEDCRVASQGFFQDFEAATEVQYQGQRTDGTHAINGTIFLETRSETFQCSYNAAGNTMVDFWTEGRSWPAFAKGGDSPHSSSSSGSSSGAGQGSTSYPIFAAECAGGVNRGGYNIDTDDRGHLWVNGHRVNLEAFSSSAWEGAYHGVVFDIGRDGGGLSVTYTAPHGANGICKIVAQ